MKKRPIYDHNPEFALARCTTDEMGRIGEYFAECANTSRGPIKILIPSQGFSIPNTPGGVFWNRDADALFESTLRAKLNPKIAVQSFAMHANSAEFGVVVAKEFLDLVKSKVA